MSEAGAGVGGHAVRDAALRVLVRVAQGRRSDRSLDDVLSRRRLDARDRALCTEIVYGTLRRQRLLDRSLSPFCNRPLAALDVPVLAALRMAAYQAAFLGSVPPHAAVHRSVEALKRVRPRATGLANAVLRAWLRAGGELHAGTGSLGQQFDLPDWLAARWSGRGDAATAWLAATQLPPRACLRASASQEPHEVLEKLRAAGAEAELGERVPGSIRVMAAKREALATVIDAGLALPRSEAAQLVTGLLQSDSMPVLDACSGRGGKARQLAEAGDLIVAIDNHRVRLDESKSLAAATGAGRLAWVRADLREGLPLTRRFGRILVDVPCSGLGTMRRHPEVKWQTSEAELVRLAAVQRDVLGTCAGGLEVGGQLLYVTCSTEPEENEQVVNSVLDSMPELRRQPFDTVPEGCTGDERGDLRTYPADPDLDGFFVARLTRLRD